MSSGAGNQPRKVDCPTCLRIPERLKLFLMGSSVINQATPETIKGKVAVITNTA